MDIIKRGDFSITNVGAKTVFSFRMPSIKRKSLAVIDELNMLLLIL